MGSGTQINVEVSTTDGHTIQMPAGGSKRVSVTATGTACGELSNLLVQNGMDDTGCPGKLGAVTASSITYSPVVGTNDCNVWVFSSGGYASGIMREQYTISGTVIQKNTTVPPGGETTQDDGTTPDASSASTLMISVGLLLGFFAT